MNETKTRTPRTALLAAAALLVAGCVGLLTTGCGNSGNSADSNKVKVAYLGLTCEAPIFVAQEKGFYKEEGLDAELVSTDWNGLRQGLNTGQFDANHTLIMYLLKPIQDGSLDAKITAGVHTGCLRVLARDDTDIKTAKDLKGKKIGIPTHLGSPPYMFACRVLAAAGIDPRPDKKEVEWLPFKPETLEQALKDKRVDAVATSDPIGTILLGTRGEKGEKLVRIVADQAEDMPYSEEYCCAAVVSGKLAKERPAIAAKVTRAILKGAKWVQENPREAAQLSVDKKFIAASVDINSQALAKLKYEPGVDRCRKSITSAAKEMATAGLLEGNTDPEKLTARAWIDLDGVNDAWVKDVKVAKGNRPRLLDPVEFAALFNGRKACCGGCCCLE